jgi:hypothetical protein
MKRFERMVDRLEQFDNPKDGDLIRQEDDVRARRIARVLLKVGEIIEIIH